MVSEVADNAVSRIDALLMEIRRGLPRRAQPSDLPALRARGALIVDIRPEAQRRRDGELPGAVVIDRNVLEWRLDPSSAHRIPQVTGGDQEIVIVCNEGFGSTLAAESLQRIGLTGVTDLAGGFQALLRTQT